MTLEILTSDLLDGLRHGFFTRKGGASSGIFKGLNCGAGSTDQSEVVSINRARVAEAMNVPSDHLVGVHQIHSADVITITDPSQGGTKADALVTATPGIALSVLSADCQPVLFADSKSGVIGAAHAGWKGALDGVLDQTVVAMVALGAVRENICAVIGPCISQRAYEVGPEFMDSFLAEDMNNARYFAGGKDDRLQFDLPAFGHDCLRATGISQAAWTRHCTYSDSDRFFYYRRSVHYKEADYGRLIAAITL
jgi:YfiH family protein